MDSKMRHSIDITARFEACILCGAIGDAWGSSYENEAKVDDAKTYYLIPQKEKERHWAITDDTQLTLATCEALCDEQGFTAAKLAKLFVLYYRTNKLTGIGASTLKAILDIEAGIHRTQAGRTGEYAAGNGAAMRIAPFAFFENIDRQQIREICRITHRNDEAYTGALAVVLAIRAALDNIWNNNNNLLDILIPQLPDTNVRDRLIAISALGTDTTIADIAKMGVDGYVVNSVPFALFAATQVGKLGLRNMLQQIIDCGGDTDTNASMAGQVAGAWLGMNNLNEELLAKLRALKGYEQITEVVKKLKLKL